VGCLLEFILTTVLEGLLHLVVWVVVETWPGFVAGLAAGAAVLYFGGYQAWPWALGAFVALWVVGGALYAGRSSRPPKRTWLRKTRDKDDGFIR
jgi:hypothetical protein